MLWMGEKKNLFNLMFNYVYQKDTIFAVGQVLYDQLLTNPPGSEGSKGSWLSGAL